MELRHRDEYYSGCPSHARSRFQVAQELMRQFIQRQCEERE
jgi:hypothetical protein